MKWKTTAREPYQVTEEGTARAHLYYYIYRVDRGLWRGGRWAFNRDIDFRVDFTSAQVARDYLAHYDRDAVIIQQLQKTGA